MTIIIITVLILLCLGLAAMLFYVNDKRDRAVFMGRMYYGWYYAQYQARLQDTKLIKAQKEYIKLLYDELQGCIHIGATTGNEERYKRAAELENLIVELEK